MTDPSFATMTTLSCTIQKKAMNGSLSDPVSLLCTPLAPVDTETRQTLGLNAPHVVWEVHLQDAPDIRKGDILKAGGVTYEIMDAAPWEWLPSDDKRYRLVLEDTNNRLTRAV